MCITDIKFSGEHIVIDEAKPNISQKFTFLGIFNSIYLSTETIADRNFWEF